MENGLTDIKVSVAKIETSMADMDRRMASMEVSLRAWQASLDALTTLTVTINVHEKRISELEGTQKRITRMVTGAFLAALIAMVFKTTGVGLKL